MSDISEELVERVARAIAERRGHQLPTPLHPFAEGSRISDFVLDARAAIAAMQSEATERARAEVLASLLSDEAREAQKAIWAMQPDPGIPVYRHPDATDEFVNPTS